MEVEEPEGLLALRAGLLATAPFKAAPRPQDTFLLTLVGLLGVARTPRLEGPVGKALPLVFFIWLLPLPALLGLLGVALAGIAAAPAACLPASTLCESDLCRHTCQCTVTDFDIVIQDYSVSQH